MDWYDETLSDIGISPESATGPTGDMSNDEIMESIGMALGAGATQAWVPQSFSASSYDSSAERATNRTDGAPRTAAVDTPEKGGILGKISDFVEKNKALSEMLIKGVAGAASGNTAKKAAEIQARNRLDELKLKNQQEQEGNARTSASVTGLRAPTGILNRGPLRRTDGTPIYTNGRIV